MFKVFGALCIIGGCGYGGFRIGREYRLRVETLRGLQNGLNLLETEISYSSTPLPLALYRIGEKLSHGSALLFLHAARLLLSKEVVNAGKAWEDGIKVLQQHVRMSKEEINILSVFGQSLGNSAKQEQLKNIELTREQLSIIEKQALEARLKYERMWQYLGFCLGAVIVLILL